MEQQEKIEQFFSQYDSLSVTPRETFLHAGDEPEGVYFLQSGHVRQYDISGRTGTELTLHIFKPGSFFPLMWALNDIPNRYFYQSVDAVQAIVAPKEAVNTFLTENPEVLLALTKRLLSGLDGMIARLQNQVFGDSYSRTISQILYLGRHFGHKEGNQVIIHEPFTHQNLADLTGSVRETVSVAIEKMLAQGLIHYEGHSIVINNQELLEQELHKLL